VNHQRLGGGFVEQHQWDAMALTDLVPIWRCGFGVLPHHSAMTGSVWIGTRQKSIKNYCIFKKNEENIQIQ